MNAILVFTPKPAGVRLLNGSWEEIWAAEQETELKNLFTVKQEQKQQVEITWLQQKFLPW